MVDILGGDNTTYMSFGSEPFTPNNELRYKSFQLQNNFTKFTQQAHADLRRHASRRYESENVFFPGSQSVYVYNTLDDFLTDANGYLANPNRTTSTRQPAPVPGALQQHPRAGEADSAAGGALRRRLRAGRVERRPTT